MLLRISIITCLILIAELSVSQNIIPNPGFEDQIEFPNDLGQWQLCKNWQGLSSPDYLNVKGLGFGQLPSAGFRIYSNPHSGNGAMGLILYSASPDQREYLYIELTEHLNVGRRYKLKVNTSNGTYDFGATEGVYAIDNIGFHFSYESYDTSTLHLDQITPTININSEVWSEAWQTHEFTFIADAEYKYLTIGNFYSDSLTNVSLKRVHQTSIGSFAYYLFDDFFLEPIDPKLIVTGPGEVCRGDSIVLNINDSLNEIYWSDIRDMNVILGTGKYFGFKPEVSGTIVARNTWDTVYFDFEVVNDPFVELGNDTVICQGEEIEIQFDYNYQNILWWDGSITNSKIISDSGLYWVQADNACGMDSDTIDVLVDSCGCKLLIPNAITPNNDLLNDQLIVYNSCELEFFRMNIYNAWGELLLTSDETTIGYDQIERHLKNVSSAFIVDVKYKFKNSSAELSKQMIINLLR